MHEEGGREGVRRRQIPFSPSFLPLGPGRKEIHSREEKKVKKDASSSLLSLRGKGRKFTYGPWPTNPANALRFPPKNEGILFLRPFFPHLGNCAPPSPSREVNANSFLVYSWDEASEETHP